MLAESETELATTLAMFEKQGNPQSQCVVVAYRALRELLLLRWAALASPPRVPRAGAPRTPTPFPPGEARGPGGEARAYALRALELADETARTIHPVERDYVRAHWLLGAAHRVNGALDEADRHLSEALTRCRNINVVEHEADILLDLAPLRAAQGHKDEALRQAQEALVITERSGYVLQGADVHLFLAQMALAACQRGSLAPRGRRAQGPMLQRFSDKLLEPV